MVACLSDDIHTVELLLDQHFTRNPSQLPPVDAAGNTVLHFSMIGNHDHVFVKLLERMQEQYSNKQMKQLVDSVNKVRHRYMYANVLLEVSAETNSKIHYSNSNWYQNDRIIDYSFWM